MPNPYQPPPDTAASAADVSRMPLQDALTGRERDLVVRGMQWIRGGSCLLLAAVIALLVKAYVLQGFSPGVTKLVLGIAILALTMTFGGLVYWSVVPGRQRQLVLFSLGLGVFATTLNAAYFFQLVGRPTVSGLFQLFGATAFAMLLTSQALMTLVTRAWSWRHESYYLARVCDLAVIAYAVCAIANTSMAMNRSLSGNTLLIVTQCLTGLIAIAFHLFALDRTLSQWTVEERRNPAITA